MRRYTIDFLDYGRKKLFYTKYDNFCRRNEENLHTAQSNDFTKLFSLQKGTMVIKKRLLVNKKAGTKSYVTS